MLKWNIGKLTIDRCGGDMLEVIIGKEKAKIATEDLAQVVKEELPQDRADKLLAAIDEKQVSQGKIRVVVEAKNDIKKGDPVAFVLDVTRYVDKYNKLGGFRATKAGILMLNS
jgi:hypothetical protein